MSDLATNAARPELVKTTTATIKQFSLAEQIEADKYLRGQTAGRSNKLGIRFRKFIPPSVNGQVDTASDQ